MKISLFTFALIATTMAAPHAAAQEVRADFDSANELEVVSQWDAIELVDGSGGKAWRSDGFSSYLTSPVTFDGSRPLSASLSVALESYPSDLELPVQRATPSSLIQQSDGKDGFDVWIDTYGRWGATIETERGEIRVRAPEVLPLYEWHTIDFSYNPATGIARLRLNDQLVGEATVRAGTDWSPAKTSLQIARPPETVSIINFTISHLNGAFDNIRVSQDSARPIAPVAKPAEVPVEASLAVPPSRFAKDHLRPTFHAMPPANWTNESHGLVAFNGRYHLFYQRTPNGPFKTQMVWGHMSSPDLVNWTHHRDVLRPELQNETFGFDMKGIWSGDVIVADNIAYAYYTSVNHGPSEAFNPGISVAASTDPLLREWQKRGPIIDTRYVEDFRDPYLWEEDGIWHMIIGAAYRSGGGLDYYTCADIAVPQNCWEHHRRFSTVPYARMDVGSIIWEMPVFEPLEDRHLLIVNPIGGDVSKYGDPATRGVYWLGDWEDGQFTPDSETPHMLDVFPGHLSPTVARLDDGTMVGIGIVDERRTPQSQEDAGWTHTFSLPREYYLNAAGLLGQRPLRTTAALRQEGVAVQADLAAGETQQVADPGHRYEAQIEFSDAAADHSYGIVLMANADGSEQTRIMFDPSTGEIILDKSASSLSGDDEGPQVLRERFDVAAFGEPREWRIFVDGSIVDVFIGDGAAFSFRAYPSQAESTVFGVVGAAGEAGGTVWQLDRAQFDYDFSESPFVG